MINRLFRFHGQGSLRKVYTRGTNVRGGTLNLKYVRNTSDRPYKVAVVVSRKVNKSAVVRNRIRRRVYEAVRTAPNQPAPGSELVFTAFNDQLAEMPAGQLHKLVQKLLEKAV